MPRQRPRAGREFLEGAEAVGAADTATAADHDPCGSKGYPYARLGRLDDADPEVVLGERGPVVVDLGRCGLAACIGTTAS